MLALCRASLAVRSARLGSGKQLYGLPSHASPLASIHSSPLLLLRARRGGAVSNSSRLASATSRGANETLSAHSRDVVLPMNNPAAFPDPDRKRLWDHEAQMSSTNIHDEDDDASVPSSSSSSTSSSSPVPSLSGRRVFRSIRIDPRVMSYISLLHLGRPSRMRRRGGRRKVLPSLKRAEASLTLKAVYVQHSVVVNAAADVCDLIVCC